MCRCVGVCSTWSSDCRICVRMDCPCLVPIPNSAEQERCHKMTFKIIVCRPRGHSEAACLVAHAVPSSVPESAVPGHRFRLRGSINKRN